MGDVFFLTLIGCGAFWVIRKLGAPWRKYHAEHIAPLEKNLAEGINRQNTVDKKRQSAAANATLFKRDFESEISKIKQDKNKAYYKLKSLRKRKSGLHDEQADVRDSLDSWHRRSRRYFFGKKGQKIPQHSFNPFGMSLNEKETYESKRDHISRGICELKEEIDYVYTSKIEPANAAFAAAVKDRKKLTCYVNQKLGPEHFSEIEANHIREYKRIEREIMKIKTEIEDAKARYKNEPKPS